MLAMSAGFAAYGQQNALKSNPLLLITLAPNLEFEHAISERESVQGGMSYSLFNFSDFNSGADVNMLSVTPAYRYYVGENASALHGLYVSPFSRYRHISFSAPDAESPEGIIRERVHTLGGGATIGWQRVSDGGFTIDLFAGPEFRFRTLNSNAGAGLSQDFRLARSGGGLRAGISIGLAF